MIKYSEKEVERLLALRAKARANLEFKDCRFSTLQTGFCMPTYDKESADADLRSNAYALADQLAAAREIVNKQKRTLQEVHMCPNGPCHTCQTPVAEALRLHEESSDE